MPEKETMERARRDKREGKSASTQAGEFVKEEMDHIREGKHGARSTEQAIAIGLSKARRAGVDLKPPRKGTASEETRKNARREYEEGHGQRHVKHRSKVSRAIKGVLKREGHKAASPEELSQHAHKAAMRRTHAERSASAKKAVATKGPAERSAAARKAARTRAAER